MIKSITSLSILFIWLQTYSVVSLCNFVLDYHSGYRTRGRGQRSGQLIDTIQNLWVFIMQKPFHSHTNGLLPSLFSLLFCLFGWLDFFLFCLYNFIWRTLAVFVACETISYQIVLPAPVHSFSILFQSKVNTYSIYNCNQSTSFPTIQPVILHLVYVTSMCWCLYMNFNSYFSFHPHHHSGPLFQI